MMQTYDEHMDIFLRTRILSTEFKYFGKYIAGYILRICYLYYTISDIA